jgi:hypothetical protein
MEGHFHVSSSGASAALGLAQCEQWRGGAGWQLGAAHLERAPRLLDDVDGLQVAAALEPQHRVHRQVGVVVLVLRRTHPCVSNTRQCVGLMLLSALVEPLVWQRQFQPGTSDTSSNSAAAEVSLLQWSVTWSGGHAARDKGSNRTAGQRQQGAARKEQQRQQRQQQHTDVKILLLRVVLAMFIKSWRNLSAHEHTTAGQRMFPATQWCFSTAPQSVAPAALLPQLQLRCSADAGTIGISCRQHYRAPC